MLGLLMQKLGDRHRQIISSQLGAINKIHRIVGWTEIDFYVMRKGQVCWDGVPALFDDREFTLVRASTFAEGGRIQSGLFCKEGHLFSIESKAPVKPIAFGRDVQIELYDLDKRFL